MAEKTLGTVSGCAGLRMNKVVPRADQEPKISCGALQLDLLPGLFEPLHEVEKRVCDAARRPILKARYAARLDPLAATDCVPLETGEAVDREPEGRRVIRMHRYP
jgi:hypothetical protein